MHKCKNEAAEVIMCLFYHFTIQARSKNVYSLLNVYSFGSWDSDWRKVGWIVGSGSTFKKKITVIAILYNKIYRAGVTSSDPARYSCWLFNLKVHLWLDISYDNALHQPNVAT
jgi:hypothetical protein